MHTVVLGKSALKASRLAYGCWRLAGTWEACEVTSEKRAQGRKAILAAFEAGYTLFDHADIYCDGEAETIFGQALKENPSMREQIVIATKCGIRKADPASLAPYRYDFSAGHIIWSCEQSLRRLGVDVIDLYQLHRPDYLMDPEEVASAFTRLKQSGKVREFGLSNCRPSQFELLQKYCPMPLIVHQVEISLTKIDAFEDGVLEQCLRDQVTPLAWSPLAGGRISSNDPIDLREPNHAQRLHIREILDQLARQHNTPRGAIALAWLLKHPAKIIPIVGSTDAGRIKEYSRAENIELSREDWYRLFEAAYGSRLP